MIFNEVEATKAIARDSGGYEKIENEYLRIHAEREKAALTLLEKEKGSAWQEIESAKEKYRETDSAFSDVRRKATEFIKTTNANASFNDVNYVFPVFAVRNMPMGVLGLIIAAIFAAAMSSISAELNALATASTIDFYKRHFKQDGTDRQYVRFGRIATFVWGMFACVVAIYATNLGSLIEVVNKFGSFFYGSLLGVFVLAIVVKRARARGAFFGLLFGITSVSIASNYTRIEFLWFNVIGCLVTVIAGYLISLTVPENSK
jgi:Na+/proline symporter